MSDKTRPHVQPKQCDTYPEDYEQRFLSGPGSVVDKLAFETPSLGLVAGLVHDVDALAVHKTFISNQYKGSAFFLKLH